MNRVSVLLNTRELIDLKVLLAAEVMRLEDMANRPGFGAAQAENLAEVATLRGRLIEAEAHTASDN